jgi:hypothetical protein
MRFFDRRVLTQTLKAPLQRFDGGLIEMVG